VYIGFDTPAPLGRGGTGSGLAAPIFADFMEKAVQRLPAEQFHVPEGMQFVPVNRATGMMAFEGEPDTIVEAFKPGTGPADVFAVIGDTEYLPPEQILETSPQAQQAVTSGAAGLF
jgi:penicillin-binding protein 1A